jgi:hypothetical protein
VKKNDGDKKEKLIMAKALIGEEYDGKG